MHREIIRKYRSIKKSLSGYHPHIQVQISKSNLIHNLHQYQKTYHNVDFAPVLKSNAYGHGLVEVASILDDQNLSFLVVDSLFEARVLRAESIKTPILVIGYVSPENIAQTKVKDTEFAITSLDQLKQINQVVDHKIIIHLKFDTGMHRQGLMPKQAAEAIEIIKSSKHIRLNGICTHFADADAKDQNFTKKQIVEWEKIVKVFKDSFTDLRYTHIANTAGSYYTYLTTNSLVRLGLGLYGVNPSPLAKLDLKPVLSLKSVVSSIREINAGESVGYNHTFTAKQKMKIVTVPVGYFEGVDRRLSDKGCFTINGQPCPIVGRVSMNITSIDVTKISGLKIGDPVTVISNHPSDPNSAMSIAKQIDTIPYEVLVKIPQHLRREVI